MSATEPAELARLIAAIPGVSTLYGPQTAATTLAALARSAANRDPVARPTVSVTADAVVIRVGIDHTRTISDIVGAIHRTVTDHLATAGRAARPAIDIQIATIL